ncbi:MAG: DUF5615 family PIN-like protein [Lamprobacter sp.]|uniref:DUF5615 family PIN-like protein n=1 Tax=Lamprobacter sp. TaxID=3100796 RepID=UPI002B25F31D|nr:DUF5615 family PIN-like protein [Lamprobacter sp.]MEA3642572.1 DUF5615 family PIN-like protein [Lamprobacter sp.]
MQVLCDVHVAYRLVSRLREIGVDATHVNRILDGSRTTDAAIAAYVDANKLLLITKDGDFRDSHFLRGTPQRLLRLVIGNVSNDELIGLVESHWPEIATASQQEHCYLELSRGGLYAPGRSR